MRPLGGVLIGYMGDKYGRKQALVLVRLEHLNENEQCPIALASPHRLLFYLRLQEPILNGCADFCNGTPAILQTSRGA